MMAKLSITALMPIQPTKKMTCVVRRSFLSLGDACPTTRQRMVVDRIARRNTGMMASGGKTNTTITETMPMRPCSAMIGARRCCRNRPSNAAFTRFARATHSQAHRAHIQGDRTAAGGPKQIRRQQRQSGVDEKQHLGSPRRLLGSFLHATGSRFSSDDSGRVVIGRSRSCVGRSRTRSSAVCNACGSLCPVERQVMKRSGRMSTASESVSW